MIGRLLTCICALAALASCSDNAPNSSKVTLDLGTEVAATIPLSNGAPSEPPLTTTAVATTPAPTIAPNTTDLATTIDPKAEVEAAYLAALDARQFCNYEPEDCDFEAIAVVGSPQDVSTRETMAARLRDNLRSVRGIGSEKVRIESSVLAGDVAFVVICALDAGVLFDVGDLATSSDDIVFDDSTVSLRVQWEMRRPDGVWLMFEGINLEKLTGGDLCEF